MRAILLTTLILLGGCTSYYNPSLGMDTNRNDQFKKDRAACRERSKKEANSEPKNDWQFLKTYDQQRIEHNNEARAFDRCMAGKGWIKK